MFRLTSRSEMQQHAEEPEAELRATDVQQLMVTDEEVPSVEQENPELLHIKDEQDEPWSRPSESVCGLNPESSHVDAVTASGLKTEASESQFTQLQSHQCVCLHPRQTEENRETPVAVKSEEDEETPQSSQLHQSQTEENRANGGGAEPEPARNSGPEAHSQPGPEDKTEDSSEFKSKAFDTKLKQRNEPGLNLVNDSGCNAVKKSFSCSQCGKMFGRKEHLQTHVRIHTGERPFICSQCGKAFGCKRSLLGHMTSHTGEKPFSCSRCGKRFGRTVNLKTHERLHTGERPFTCPFCGKGFTQKVHMTQHVAVHTGDKQFSCSVCGKKFRWLSGCRRHKCGGEQSEQDETEEIPELGLED